MPLTSHSTELDDIEMNRRIAETLRQRSMEASKMGVDSLAAMEALAQKGRANDLAKDKLANDQGKLVLEQGKEAREAAAGATTLKLKQNEDARQAAEEARAVETQARNAPILQRKLDDEERKASGLVLQSIVESERAKKNGGLTRVGVAKAAHDNPNLAALTGDDDVDAEFTRQETADADKAAKAGNVAGDDARAERFHADSLVESEKNRQSTERAAAAKANAAANPNNFAITDTMRTQLQKERNTLASASDSAKELRSLMKRYNIEAFVGPIDGRLNYLKTKFGLNDEQASQVLSTLQRAFTEYKVAATGASAGVQEMSDLLNQVPNETDSVEQIKGKLNAGDALMKSGFARIDGSLGSNDIRGAPAPASAKPVTPQTQDAAKRYRAASPEQRAAINALAAKGVAREAAVAQILGGG
jgi:hypothetical protein